MTLPLTTGPRVWMTGAGKSVPTRIVTNEEIGKRLNVDAEWITSRTGIQERRFAADDESAASLGGQAARQAIERAGLKSSDIDAVLVATCTPDYVFPPTATIIQDALGIGSVAAFDVNAACSGFVYALQTAAAMATGGMGRRILVVGVDLLSRHLDLDDLVTAPLFGDGAGAVVLEASDEAGPAIFEMGSDGSGGAHVIVPGSGSRLPGDLDLGSQPGCITMSGREFYRRAVKTMSDQGARVGAGGFDMLIAHQANRRILDECATQMNIDKAKVFMNIAKYGNTSAGSIPLALCEAWESGSVRKGSRLLLLGFGAGYTWGASLLTWGGQTAGGAEQAEQVDTVLSPVTA